MTKKTTTAPETADPSILLRELGGKPLHRTMAIDHSTLNVEARTVEVAVSSEFPVRRYFGMEILDHSPEAVDLGRLKAAAPLLDMHDRWTQIGVVEDAWLDDDRKLRARVRYSKNPHAEEVWQDVVDKIRQNISVGYDPKAMRLERTEGDLKFYRVISWEPYEVSNVSIPADPTVGVDRSLPEPVQTNQPVQGNEMPPEIITGTPADAAAIEAAANQRSADIYSLCQRHNAMGMLGEALSGGLSVDQVRAKILDGINPVPTSQAPESSTRNGELPRFVDVSARGLGLSKKEQESYSLLRALNAAADNDWKDAGLEREVSIAIADASGKPARGIYVPHDLVAARAYRDGMTATAGAGAELIATDLRTDLFVDMVRNRAVMGALGARIVGGLRGDVDIPKKVAGANFYWVAENEAPPLSKMDLTTLLLKPKTIAGAIPVSRRLRKQSSMSVEQLIVSDLVNGIAIAIDLAMLYGTGQDNQPLGLFNQLGIPALTYGAGGITFGDLIDMETKVATFNADSGALKYLTSVQERGYAKKTKEDPDGADSTKIWVNNEVNGCPALASNQVKQGVWAFGDWSQAMIGMWGALDLKPDPYAMAGSDGLVVRVFQDVDAGFRNLSSFSVNKKAA